MARPSWSKSPEFSSRCFRPATSSSWTNCRLTRSPVSAGLSRRSHRRTLPPAVFAGLQSDRASLRQVQSLPAQDCRREPFQTCGRPSHRSSKPSNRMNASATSPTQAIIWITLEPCFVPSRAPELNPSRSSGSSCVRPTSPIASSRPTTRSSTPPARPRTASSTGLAKSCLSDCATRPKRSILVTQGISRPRERERRSG